VKKVVVPLVVADVMRTLPGGAPDAEARDERTELPKAHAKEELRADGDTAGDMTTATAMICASGDRDGVGDGVTEDDADSDATTVVVADGD
jgi:hypothetical protein